MSRTIYHEIDAYRRLLADPSRPRFAAWDVKIRYAINDSGELSLTIAPENPEFLPLLCAVSELVVYDDGVEMWRGRLTEQEIDMYGRKSLTAKGMLDYLHDSILPSQTLSGSAASVLGTLIAAHNAKPIENRKRFSVGSCTVSANVEDLRVNAGATTWSAVSELVKKYGGYIQTQRVGNANVISWVQENTHICSQPISFGSNLLDLKQYIGSDKLATVIYAYGKATDDVPLDIGSVNNGIPYIKDDDAVAAFGWIEGSYVDNSCEDAAALKAAAERELQNRLAEVQTIRLSAVDLSDIGAAERIEIGMRVPVISQPHKIDEVMPCTELERYLYDPKRTKLSLGASMRAVSAILGGYT